MKRLGCCQETPPGVLQSWCTWRHGTGGVPWVPRHPPLRVFWAPERVQDSAKGPSPFMFLWTLQLVSRSDLGLKSAQAGGKQWVLEVWGHSCVSMD